MDKKIIYGGLAGGVAFFFLGWIIYGMLMADYMAANYNMCSMKPEEQMTWWALILSCFIWGFFMAYIYSRTNTSGFVGGMKMGACLGLMICAAYDLQFFSMTTMFYGMKPMVVDILVGTVNTAIGGGIVGAAMGMGNKTAA